MKNFDIAKYLKEHKLGSYGILNQYVDLEPIKEIMSKEEWKKTVEDDHKEMEIRARTAQGPEGDYAHRWLRDNPSPKTDDADYQKYVEKETGKNKGSNNLSEEANAEKIHLAIGYLKSQGLSDEEIMQIPDHLAMYNQYLDKSAMTEEEQNEDWDPSARTSPQVSQSIGIKNIIGRATEALAKAGLTKNQILMFASAVNSDPKSLDKAMSTLAFE